MRGLRGAFVAAALSSVLASAPVAADQKTVLILWGGRVDLPVNTVVNQAIRSRLFREFGSGVDIRFEHVEPSPGAHDQELVLRDFIRRKYAGQRFDLLIAVTDTALAFVRAHGRELFPDVPIVGWGNAVVMEARGSGPPITGVAIEPDPAATLEFILRLRPGTREVVVIAGGSDYDDPGYLAIVQRACAAYEKRLTITYLVGYPLEEVRRRVAQLPEHSAILWTTMNGDGAGRRLVNVDALSLVAASANVPAFGMAASYLGAGIVGGVLGSQQVVSEDTADLAVRVLRGARVQDIPIVRAHLTPTVDWRQLRRWGIPESRLPPGTVVHNKEPSLWDAHKERIVGIAALCLGQTLLIVMLLVQRTRRRRAESLHSAVLASLQDHVALLDADGTVVEVNDSWSRFAQENGGGHVRGHTLPPENYLEACRRAEDPQDTIVAAARKGLEDVLRGAQRQFQFEYSCPTRTGIRWFIMTAEPLRRPAGGAVVTHSEVTERREAEHAAQEQRRQLAHLGRVAMLGELSGTLAHELNQPLTAILSNAEAAQRMLAMDQPDLEDVRDSLDDIVAADRRASEVIRRLRAMLKRTETQSQPVDVNEIAREVIELAHADLLARGVTVAMRLQDGLPAVAGDRVQLQQVLLNLVLNGCDAMAGFAPAQRELVVASRGEETGEVVIHVQDRGTGIADGDVDRIFEPFFTSKPEGLGLGLAICRTIASGHGGRLWASNNDGERGATLHLALPSAGSHASAAP